MQPHFIKTKTMVAKFIFISQKIHDIANYVILSKFCYTATDKKTLKKPLILV